MVGGGGWRWMEVSTPCSANQIYSQGSVLHWKLWVYFVVIFGIYTVSYTSFSLDKTSLKVIEDIDSWFHQCYSSFLGRSYGQTLTNWKLKEKKTQLERNGRIETDEMKFARCNIDWRKTCHFHHLCLFLSSLFSPLSFSEMKALLVRQMAIADLLVIIQHFENWRTIHKSEANTWK